MVQKVRLDGQFGELIKSRYFEWRYTILSQYFLQNELNDQLLIKMSFIKTFPAQKYTAAKHLNRKESQNKLQN